MNDDAPIAVAVREHDAALPLPPMNDAEVATAFRTATALASSGMFKDIRSARQAYVKIIAGRDLGLTPFESMSALHVMEGKIEAGADLHATRVRQRRPDGYDYRVAWLKVVTPGKKDDDDPVVEAVWSNEEDLADIRDVYGCAIEFTFPTVDGPGRGVSRFTEKDARKAGLLKERSNHEKFPRNMWFARAMTNGVAWFMPEVMGGLRVYGLGEVQPEGGADVTAGTAEADRDAAGVELPIEVEAVLARARSLGHVGIAQRATAEWALREPLARGDSDVVQKWIDDRTRELNRFAQGRAAPEPAEPPDAVVVEDLREAADNAEASGLAGAADELRRAAAAAEAGGDEALAAPHLSDGERAVMRDRANELVDIAERFDEEGESERATEARLEAEQLREDAGPPPEDPEQDALPL